MKPEEKILIQKNKELWDFLVKNDKLLSIESWNDFDDEGCSSGIDLTFCYEEEVKIEIAATDGPVLKKAIVSVWAAEELELTFSFSKEQKEVIELWLTECLTEWKEDRSPYLL